MPRNLIDSAGVRRLILNADDFGLTPGVNRSILELAQTGVLTSATLMATGEAFSQAVAESASAAELGVGCHVVLLDGQSAAPPEAIPTLASPQGQLRPTLGQFARDLYLGRIASEHIEAEAVAQIQRLHQAGVRVTHVDTHKHTHLFPAVLRPLLRAAMRCGIRAIRNPFEPSWAIAVTPGASTVRRVQIGILNRNHETFTRLVRQAGLATTDGAIGVLATGVLDAPILHRLLTAMPPGTWELVCHPGYEDTALASVRTRLRASRAIEHQALLITVPDFPGIERISFGHLTGARP
ncbi:MAG TPA: ChbG/HpnK family deacetylase [Acidobacterium sp.]|nr:ChbG/HpnK family deacetylase [Acidobacterium sp.]